VVAALDGMKLRYPPLPADVDFDHMTIE